MIVKYFIIWMTVSLATTTTTQEDIDSCLTGYMTDLQGWVDPRGRLTNRAPLANRIDVSYGNGTIQRLFNALREFKCSRNGTSAVVEYLGMARGQLQQVPRIFDNGDGCGQILSVTVTYLTLYGNDFGGSIISNRNLTIYNDTWSSGFRGVRFQHLRELDLRLCGITELEGGIFSEMINLETLYLGENNIYTIGEHTFKGLRRLIHLDLSRIDRGMHFSDMNVFAAMARLNSIDLSFTKLSQLDLLAFRSVSRSLQRLSICHSGLSNMGANFFANTSMRFLDVSGNINIFNDVGALRGVESTLQVIYADDVALRSVRVFENLTSLEILRISNNEITSIDRNAIRNLQNLQVLIMDSNRLTTWFNPVVSTMSRLKFLSLRHNNINLISDDMMMDLRNISYVGLSGNNIVCNCNARELYELAVRNEDIRDATPIYPLNNNEMRSMLFHRGFKDVNYMIAERIHVVPTCSGGECDEHAHIDTTGNYLIFDYDLPTYSCMQATEGRSMSFGRVPFCKTRNDLDYDHVISETWNMFYLLTLPALLLPLCIFGYVFHRNIRYFFITIRNSAMLSLINKDEVIDENTIFNYDVFVSYCHEDRGWVLDQLLPHVEVDANISVCLHERDFTVGLSILENIVSCMDRSKTILLILSQKFLLSQWCQFEMHLAQHRLLETRREDLILVLLENIPRRVRPNTLHYLMVTNTYIVWPKEEAEQPLFWRRLHKSLTTHKMKQTSTDSLA